MQITILDGYALNPGDLSWDCFKQYANLKIYNNTPSDKVIERIGDSEAILLNKINITSEILENCPNLKYIGVLATGYNVIDLQATNKKNICVTNIPSYSTMAVAQHVFALITHFTNHVALHDQSVKNNDWINNETFCYWKKPLIELSGKTLGILGYGNIGKQVEKIANAFGMNVIVCPHKKNNQIKNSVSLEELFSKSDFLSLHTPLTEETKEIVNKKTISLMKNNAYIINTARGGLVNEKDLNEALQSEKIAGYGCDVLLTEPMDKNCPLKEAKNCVITPHIAWAPLETRERLLEIALSNFKSWLDGDPKNRIIK